MSLPLPLPGEVVHSFIARIAMRAGAKSPATVLRRMGLRPNAALVSPLGVGIGHLYRAYPHLATHLAPQDMVWRHTTAPLLIAFSQHHRTAEQRAAFSAGVVEKGGWAQGPRICVSLKPQGLRHCTECQSEDVTAHGVAYWHREHQVGPVTHCWRHGTPLREYRWEPGLRLPLELPGYGRYADQAPGVVSPDMATSGLAVQVAQTFAMLLQSQEGFDPDAVRSAIQRSAHDAGIMSRQGPSRRRVWGRVMLAYGERYLQDLRYPTTYSTHIASRYVRPLQAGESADPVLTVLLADALGTKLDAQTFGESHKPSVVVAAAESSKDEALELALKEGGYVLHRAMISLGINRQQLIRRIIRAGITCPIAIGSNAKYQAETVQGMIDALRAGNSRMAVREKYGCNSSFMDQLAIYDPALRTVMKQHRSDQVLNANRQAVLSYLAMHADAGRQELWQDLPGPMSLLAKRDKSWLRAQLDGIIRRHGALPGATAGRGRVDDRLQDTEFETRLRAVVPALNALEPPRRRTATLALKLARIPLGTFGKLQAGRLPNTKAALYEIVETEASYVARKLDYTFERLVKGRRTVTFTAVRLASGLTPRILETYRGVVQLMAEKYGMPFSSRAAAWLSTPVPPSLEEPGVRLVS